MSGGKLHAEVDGAGHVVRTIPGAGTLGIPGLVNAHSHAFQRALRGRVERRSADHPNDDFWAWRETMYADSAKVTPADVEALAAWAYADMLEAGFVAVAEFHYLHHGADGESYGAPVMSQAVARGARRVGIRLLLLETAYLRGGFDRPLVREQLRFSFPDVAAYLAHVERSRAGAAEEHAAVGVAIHSVRAVPRAAIEAVARYAGDQKLPLHVHACEQLREIVECRREHGMTPIALLDACGALGPGTTVIHATHLEDDDVALLGKSGARVCLTPTTERNLGDGMCRTADLVAAGVPICVGTDSHARIDAVDELRAVEDNERLRLMRRNVLVPPGGRLAHALLPMGTTVGEAALGFSVPSRVTVRMPLEGRAGDPAAGLDAWLVGGSSRDVQEVEIGGSTFMRDGLLVSADRARIDEDARAVLQRLR